MNAQFQLKCRHSKDNLHVWMAGVFDGASAHELLRLLQAEYSGVGRIFINTSELRDINPLEKDVLRTHLQQTAISANCLYFKGEKGFTIAPSGSRVLILPSRLKEKDRNPPAHVCTGKCAQCRCHKRHTEERVAVNA